MKQNLEVDQRWRSFLGQFDQDFEIVANIHGNFGELLVPLFGWDATEAFFQKLYAQASIDLPELGISRAITAAGNPDFPLPRLKADQVYHFVALVHLYAYWGLESAPDGSLAWVNGVEDVHKFRESGLLGMAGSGSTGYYELVTASGRYETLANALRAANARYIIDGYNDSSITPLELAALAQIDIKTLRNSLTPSGQKKSGLRLDQNGSIISDSAKTWLLSRSNFLPTISKVTGSSATQRPQTVGSEQDLVFIPVAEDGSTFTPNTCRTGKYYVETPEGETTFENYTDALKALSVMAVPTWRRASPDGRWGFVRANAWRRTTKTELGVEGDV